MKLISWNVNGLRACMTKGFMDFFNEADADIFCLQETKLQAGQIEMKLPGYEQFWNYAEKKGYSGVAVFTRQEHTDLLLRVGKQDCGTGLEREQTAVCDGLLTDEPGAALVCFGADCTTLLLFDPVRQAIAAVHAGWRGTAQGIAYKAVLRMQAEFGCAPEHIHAAIGPCIGRCCFEVGPEVPEAMRRSLGPDAEAAIEPHGEKSHVDLKRLNRIWLERAGVQVIDICPDCTKCQPERFWSHRVTGGNRGSQAAIIRLKGGAPA